MMVLLLKAAIVLSILLGFYKLFLQKESFFGINRTYLIIGLLLTFMLPFVTLPELINYQGIVDTVVTETKMTSFNIPSENADGLSVEVQKYEIIESSEEIIASNSY